MNSYYILNKFIIVIMAVILITTATASSAIPVVDPTVNATAILNSATTVTNHVATTADRLRQHLESLKSWSDQFDLTWKKYKTIADTYNTTLGIANNTAYFVNNLFNPWRYKVDIEKENQRVKELKEKNEKAKALTEAIPSDKSERKIWAQLQPNYNTERIKHPLFPAGSPLNDRNNSFYDMMTSHAIVNKSILDKSTQLNDIIATLQAQVAEAPDGVSQGEFQNMLSAQQAMLTAHTLMVNNIQSEQKNELLQFSQTIARSTACGEFKRSC